MYGQMIHSNSNLNSSKGRKLNENVNILIIYQKISLVGLLVKKWFPNEVRRKISLRRPRKAEIKNNH